MFILMKGDINLLDNGHKKFCLVDNNENFVNLNAFDSALEITNDIRLFTYIHKIDHCEQFLERLNELIKFDKELDVSNINLPLKVIKLNFDDIKLKNEYKGVVFLENLNYEEMKARVKHLEDENSELRKQLEDEKKNSRRLNLDAQRWFDVAMEFMHKN